jgi:hypothetical protein
MPSIVSIAKKSVFLWYPRSGWLKFSTLEPIELQTRDDLPAASLAWTLHRAQPREIFVVKSMVRTWLLSLVAVWAGVASAQDSPPAPLKDCPAFPADAAESMRWEVLRVPDTLLCRALLTEGGTEAFALTVSPESPFKPRRGDRAEVGVFGGREVQWYRGEVPNDKAGLIRETLIRVGEEQVVHVFMRATDPETLARRQQMVLSLPLPIYADD